MKASLGKSKGLKGFREIKGSSEIKGLKGFKGLKKENRLKRVSPLVFKLAEFIRLTSSSLPDDTERALKRALMREMGEFKGSSEINGLKGFNGLREINGLKGFKGLSESKGLKEPGPVTNSPAVTVLKTILENVALARRQGTPLCQDTGTLTFFVDESLRRKVTPEILCKAVALATEKGWLRRNTIDPLSGKSIDSNVCPGAPVVHYVNGRKAPDGSGGRVSLLMKGGGSENMSIQFSLPDASLGAGRDLEGVRRAVLAAGQRAQGFGCAPGILGVCIGGDRASGFEEAKHQLMRDLGDKNPNPILARLERRILNEANSLGIGPMGLGGNTTLLAIKIGSRPRVPASFFVTVAYLCWAARRRTICL